MSWEITFIDLNMRMLVLPFTSICVDSRDFKFHSHPNHLCSCIKDGIRAQWRNKRTTSSTGQRRVVAAQSSGHGNDVQSAVKQEKVVSRLTVKRRLVEHDLNGKVAVGKPLLRARNKCKRLLWAKNSKVTRKKIVKKLFLRMNPNSNYTGQAAHLFQTSKEREIRKFVR